MGALYDWSAEVVRSIYDSRIVGPATLELDKNFPDSRHFVNSWRAIRTEALALAANIERIPRFHDFMPEQYELSAGDGHDWRLFILKAYGTEIPHNMMTCPVLSSLASSIPDVLSASLSFLTPRKHIPEHRGPFRGVVRFYMGLSVPYGCDGRPATILKIDGIDHRVGDGECLLWDDTYPHEVINDSDRIRAALLLDVRRHDMPLDMEMFSRMLIGLAGMSVRIRGVNGLQ
jgi:aspartate beta-hydroxylase